MSCVHISEMPGKRLHLQNFFCTMTKEVAECTAHIFFGQSNDASGRPHAPSVRILEHVQLPSNPLLAAALETSSSLLSLQVTQAGGATGLACGDKVDRFDMAMSLRTSPVIR